jgi:hypothetical protein
MGQQQSSGDIAKAASEDDSISSDGSRSRSRSWQWSRSTDTAVCKLMLPVYYIEEPLTRTELELAKNSWKLIDENLARSYVQLKTQEGCEFSTCSDWFCEVYFGRLFDVHPLARTMFSDPQSKQRFLTALFKMIFTGLDDIKKFDESLIKLAERYKIVKNYRFVI